MKNTKFWMFFNLFFLITPQMAQALDLKEALKSGTDTHKRQMVADVTLDSFEIDPALPFANEIVEAKLQINFSEALVTLRLERAFSCPSGQLCAQVMPPPVFVRIPLVSQGKADLCGARYYKAQKDERQEDRLYQEIIVIDRSGSKCTGSQDEAVEVIYKTISSDGEENTKSEFFGGALSSFFGW